MAWAFGDADLALQLLVSHAPENDDLDFAGESGSANDVALVESWSSTARDHRVVARAWERFGKRQGAAAELETARSLDAAGQHEPAAEALLRAFALREGEPFELVEQIVELARAVLPQASQEAALATLLADDVPRLGDDHPEVATRWREIAALRARTADFLGVLDALFEAGRCAPADEDLWQEIADAAEAVGAHDRLAAALAQRLSRARPDRRVQLLRKLARVLEHDLGRDSEAAERWAELVRLLPLDTEAGDALERIAERQGGGPELVELLRARASRLPAGHPDRVRVLRRLSRELAGHPVRRGEVLAALREVHQHSPGDVEVAAQLATLARAAGDIGTAAEALLRAFRGSEPGEARTWLAIEAARVLLELHDLETAARLLHEAASEPNIEKDQRVLELVRLQLEVAVARADGHEEAAARVRLAELDREAPPRTRATHALAAARVLREAGDLVAARKLAWTAARLLPGDPYATALLCELELGNAPPSGRVAEPSDAELLTLVNEVEVLSPAPAELLSLVACARADLLDAVRGGGAGYQDLHGWPEVVRSQPLVQLALAERLSAEWSYAAAAAAYEKAFAGDLRGMRPLGPTALRAADAAARCNDPVRARAFLDLAARDPECRIDARKRAVDLARAANDREGALRALERLAAEASGNVRATALAEQASVVGEADPEGAVEIMRLAVQAADGPLREKLASDLRGLESPRETRSLPPAPPPSLRDSGVRSSLPLEAALAGAAAEPVAVPPAPAAPEFLGPHSESTPPPLGEGRSLTRRLPLRAKGAVRSRRSRPSRTRPPSPGSATPLDPPRRPRRTGRRRARRTDRDRCRHCPWSRVRHRSIARPRARSPSTPTPGSTIASAPSGSSPGSRRRVAISSKPSATTSRPSNSATSTRGTARPTC
ncbi:MAG: hypothetical protein IPJ34_36330 [Myxococcales bacterium]|nr:hypothetical protein [Myxococcales bacterium]